MNRPVGEWFWDDNQWTMLYPEEPHSVMFEITRIRDCYILYCWIPNVDVRSILMIG